MNVVFAGKKFTAADLRSIFKEPLKSTKELDLEEEFFLEDHQENQIGKVMLDVLLEN